MTIGIKHPNATEDPPLINNSKNRVWAVLSDVALSSTLSLGGKSHTSHIQTRLILANLAKYFNLYPIFNILIG